MAKFAIVGDSTCDLNKELRDLYDIDYAKMGVVIGQDQKEMAADLDWKEYSVKDLYTWMREGTRVKTTQVSQQEFIDVFSRHLDKGEDVLYVACSSALSGSINFAGLAKEELMKKYPKAKIVLIDSLCACMGQGMMLMKASELRKEGKSLEETAKWIEENKLKFNQFCAIESLTYLARAGRVKAAKAFFGNIFGVKPIIISDANGTNNAVEKVKGRKASLDRIFDMAKEAIEDADKQYVCVVHSDDEVAAKMLVERIKSEINPKGVYLNDLGPIIGASCGPGTVAIYVYGKEVTIK